MNDKNKKDNANDFIDQVCNSVFNDANFKMALVAIPQIVGMVKATYDEMKKQGFTEVQAYDFAKSMMLSSINAGGK